MNDTSGGSAASEDYDTSSGLARYVEGFWSLFVRSYLQSAWEFYM